MSLYACDFFTIDTIMGKRYYVSFILYMKSSEIIQHTVTSNPCREFVNQQLIEFSNSIMEEKVYLIYDRSLELCCFHYEDYEVQTEGKIASIPILSGLHHHYEPHSV